MNYEAYLKTKTITTMDCGIDTDALSINPALFEWQSLIVKWALRKGRACIFAMTGLGKTLMQLEWAHQVSTHANGKVLILAPLTVANQTAREAAHFGINARVVDQPSQVEDGISITNYHKIDRFDDLSMFDGIVLDESSILKNFEGKFRNRIIESFRGTKFKLACTATPAPNDYMELGNHAEFVGVMSRAEMLSMFFVHDGGDTSQWRIKGHAQNDFWKWVCSWAAMIRKPSDLGFPDGTFELPPLRTHAIQTDAVAVDGWLIPVQAQTLQERRSARRASLGDRVAACAGIANADSDQWIVWCDLNDESAALAKSINGATEVRGSDSNEFKEQAVIDFLSGKIRVLVSKPSMFGYGLNLQCCHKMAFVGLSDSWEQYFQAVRRCWRFGQTQPVDVYVISSETEGAVVSNIKRKDADAERMATEMSKQTKAIVTENIKGATVTQDTYQTRHEHGNGWDLYLGDCVEVVQKLASDSIDFSVFSPPFDSLYTYSASHRDMGNCASKEEFATHFQFIIKELARVLKPGRNVSFHCMNLPRSKTRDGFIGIRDFRGELIRAFESEGFIFHSEVCIWKDPVTAMQRTKALGLLHKQLAKDSSMSRQGIPDYLVTMRKPGTNVIPIQGELDRWVGDDSFAGSGKKMSIDLWQRYASPVWMDINQSRTLQKQSAREEQDERHICPLQLDVIERALMLWSNPGDLVLSPFAGIGSEGYVAVGMGRRFVGAELKKSYYEQAVNNLATAASNASGGQLGLFG